jgi:hypothetical protein
MFFDHLAERPVPAAAQIKASEASALWMLFPDGGDSVGGGNACRDRRRSARHAAIGATRPADDNDGEAAMERKKRGGYF